MYLIPRAGRLWIRLRMGDNSLMKEVMQSAAPALPPEMDPLQARRFLAEHATNPAFALLDVRTPEEHDELHLAGDQLLDIYDYGFTEQIQALPRQHSYLLYCRTGNRSGLACEMMRRSGFSSVCNLSGGIKLWIERGLPVLSAED